MGRGNKWDVLSQRKKESTGQLVTKNQNDRQAYDEEDAISEQNRRVLGADILTCHVSGR